MPFFETSVQEIKYKVLKRLRSWRMMMKLRRRT